MFSAQEAHEVRGSPPSKPNMLGVGAVMSRETFLPRKASAEFLSSIPRSLLHPQTPPDSTSGSPVVKLEGMYLSQLRILVKTRQKQVLEAANTSGRILLICFKYCVSRVLSDPSFDSPQLIHQSFRQIAQPRGVRSRCRSHRTILWINAILDPSFSSPHTPTWLYSASTSAFNASLFHPRARLSKLRHQQRVLPFKDGWLPKPAP